MRLSTALVMVVWALLVYASRDVDAQCDYPVSADPTNIASGGTTQLTSPSQCWNGYYWVYYISRLWSDNGAGGVFWPSPEAQNPTWRGPGNYTGAPIERSLTVRMESGSGSVVAGVTVWEDFDPHFLTVAASVSPASVPSGGTAYPSGAASCSLGHPIASWSWTDNGAGGSFSPSASVQFPIYTAAVNLSDTDLIVTLTLTATCDSPDPRTASDSTTLTVEPQVHTFSVTAGCDPTFVPSGGTTDCSASFLDSHGHGATDWSWNDAGAGGSFTPSANLQNVSYTAPINDTADAILLNLGVTASCDGSDPITDGDSVSLTVLPTHILSVHSTPVTGVSIALSPPDRQGHAGGTTSFIHVYDEGTVVELSAAPTSGTYAFDYWDVDGACQGKGVAQIAVTMNRPHAGTAHYLVQHFSDVPPDHWAWREIEACFNAGIVSGYSETKYEPTRSVSRDQIAVFISRAVAGATVPAGPEEATFDDVLTDHWAYEYIEYCFAEGIVQGFDPATYGPEITVARDAMAVFICRAVAGGETNVPDGPDTATFDDVPTDHWAYKYVEYCVAEGIVQGYDPVTYGPTTTVARDQMAVFISRAFDLPM